MNGPFCLTDLGIGSVDLLRSGTMVVRDVAADSRFGAAEIERCKAIDVSAQIIVPLIRQRGFVAALIVHQNGPRDWTPYEVGIARETAERTWDALERVSAQNALKRTREVLEKLVDERTKKLAKSELKYRTLAETANDGFWWTDADGRITEISEGWRTCWVTRSMSYLEDTGRTSSTWDGRSWHLRSGGSGSRGRSPSST